MAFVFGAPLRPFHGVITAAELSGANGGFARYVLTIEPWTAFLGLGRDSRVFQDMDVLAILDTVFRGTEGRGQVAPAWRFEIADPGMYAKRSLCTQYQESDLAFARRLMHEEGLFYFFEHTGNAHRKDKPNQKTGIKFHAAAGTLSARVQYDATRLTADKSVTVASVGKTVTIATPKKHVLLAAQGASIRLEGGDVMLHAPGKVEFEASMKELKGPMSIPGRYTRWRSSSQPLMDSRRPPMCP